MVRPVFPDRSEGEVEEDIYDVESQFEEEVTAPNISVQPEQKLIYQYNSNCIEKEGTILVTDEIDATTYNSFLVAFRNLESQGKPINIIVNTPGGDITCMFSMYDMIQSSFVPVTTIGTGTVCSAGVLLLACGKYRYVTENCTLMSHQGSYDAGEKFDEFKSRYKFAEWCEKRWCTLMARHTPKDASHWKRVSEKEAELWFLGGEDIVSAGLADKVIDKSMVEFFGQNNEAAKRKE